ncbi:DUF4118 domain-containing protein [Methanosphaerula palustris]|uniref:Osmosensitive K channel His kinase sensor n=1 Tax=Methanosphaerula palustris (strain ATCC BAA-1556 / DSM 19958 / E1-9c) TaxID=521011 RepID=B8GEQ9_METPE|nr:DUF4118 domain-containing protein [Methanosphaerula palustris]ACL17760.1 Osmosensitive K channel His kinase sensor [Methanosphaerula palustris E1-9c]
MTGDDGRPLPDDLLSLAREDDRRRTEGKLTVYLGYASGVGKTYTMLADALGWRTAGTDVVIGYVETHGRPETDALAARLEAVQPKVVDYLGIHLNEMDLDAVLARNPAVVLVDELAHTMAPGQRHTKRYQEIEELLRAGISVCTTVNIQHIESEHDAVARITGIQVHETVPDTFLELAGDLRLIDLPPDQLVERLHAGKVYIQDMAALAVARFFTPANLIALRQLALRFVAGSTDRELVGLMHSQAIAGPWPAAERVLVGVRTGPYADQMVRAGYRVASRLQAEWIVLSVETEDDLGAPVKDQAHLREALETARRLGGRVVRYRAEDVAGEIIRHAKRNNVTTILLGKPRGLGLFLSPVYRVMRHTQGIALHLVDPIERTRIPIRRQLPIPSIPDAGIALVLIGGVAAVNVTLRDTLSPSNLLIIQLIPVVIAALFLGRAASVFAVAVSILLFDILFVPPYYTIAISDWQYFISFIGYLVVALVISNLASRLRYLLPQIRESEATVAAMSGLSKDLDVATTRQEVFERLVDHLHQVTGGPVTVLIPKGGELARTAGDPTYPLDEKEEAIAAWVYENRRPAGQGMETLPAGHGRYLPLVVSGRALGVVGVMPEEHGGPADEVLEGMVRLGSLVLDRLA